MLLQNKLINDAGLEFSIQPIIHIKLIIMKKTLIWSFTGLFFACTITGITYSQSSGSVAKLKLPIPEKNISLLNSEMTPASII